MFATKNIMELELITAITAALHAGKEILDIYDSPEADFQIETKADHSPLTIADRKSNATIMSYLTQTPYPIISEENRTVPYDIRRQWETVWIVDPLDGTKEFIKRNDEFTVNIALVEKGIPVLGVIYIPARKILYYGTQKNGSYQIQNITYESGMDFDIISSRARRLPLTFSRTSYVAVASRSHMSQETASFIEELHRQHGSLELVSVGSSVKICLVADGSADIYPRFAPTMEWDTAAGHAIVLGSGKNMYQEDGETPLHYNKENLLNPWFIVK